MRHRKFSFLAIVVAVCFIAAAGYHYGFSHAEPEENAATDAAKSNHYTGGTSVDLTESQSGAFKVETAVTRNFFAQKEAVGNIVYHEKNVAVADSTALDSASKYLVANVHENDSPFIRVGQKVVVKMLAYPDRTFTGKVSALGVTAYDTGGNPAIDPATHRIAVRCEISDPKNQLFPGMLANVEIQIEDPIESVAAPKNAVVREGDGTMTAWVTSDRRHFEKRTVKTGISQDDYVQILDGIKPGELIATDNAVFLGNMNTDTPND